MNFTSYNSCRPNRTNCGEDFTDAPHHIFQMLNHFKSPKENLITNGSTFQGDQFGCLEGKKYCPAKGNHIASDIEGKSTSHNSNMHVSVSIAPSIKPMMNQNGKGFSWMLPAPQGITLPLEAERGLYTHGMAPIYYYCFPQNPNLGPLFDPTHLAFASGPGNEFWALHENDFGCSSTNSNFSYSDNFLNSKKTHKLNPDAKEYIPKTMRTSEPREVVHKKEDCESNGLPSPVLETLQETSYSVMDNKTVGRLPSSEVIPSSSMPPLSDYGFINDINSVCTTSNESSAIGVTISSNPLHPVHHTEVTSSSDLALKSESAKVPLLVDSCLHEKAEEKNCEVTDASETKLEDTNDTEDDDDDDDSESSESEDCSEDDGHDYSDVECESDNDDGIYFTEQDEEFCQSVPNSGRGVISFILSPGSDSECEDEEESENETDYDCDFFKLVPQGEDVTFPIGLAISEFFSTSDGTNADECDSSNAERSKELKLINQRWNKNVMKDCCKRTPEKESICDISDKSKRVTFSDNVQIRPIVTYNNDVSALQWVLDRMRFRARINETESILSPILDSRHREKVFKLYHNGS